MPYLFFLSQLPVQWPRQVQVHGYEKTTHKQNGSVKRIKNITAFYKIFSNSSYNLRSIASDVTGLLWIVFGIYGTENSHSLLAQRILT